jgi:hypothetical protein
MLLFDFNKDGAIDILSVGNNYAQETLFGRYDASVGLILLGDGRDNFTAVNPLQWNLIIDRDARHVEALKTSKGHVIVIGNNNDRLQMFEF